MPRSAKAANRNRMARRVRARTDGGAFRRFELAAGFGFNRETERAGRARGGRQRSAVGAERKRATEGIGKRRADPLSPANEGEPSFPAKESVCRGSVPRTSRRAPWTGRSAEGASTESARFARRAPTVRKTFWSTG